MERDIFWALLPNLASCLRLPRLILHSKHLQIAVRQPKSQGGKQHCTRLYWGFHFMLWSVPYPSFSWRNNIEAQACATNISYFVFSTAPFLFFFWQHWCLIIAIMKQDMYVRKLYWLLRWQYARNSIIAWQKALPKLLLPSKGFALQASKHIFLGRQKLAYFFCTKE